MQTRIVAATNKLGSGARLLPTTMTSASGERRPSLLLLSLRLLLLLLLTASPVWLYVTIIRGGRGAGGLDAGVDAGVAGVTGVAGVWGDGSIEQQQQQQQQQFADNQTSEAASGRPLSPGVGVLSRRRRYLVFPAESSLQLVFDEVIPIVDYTLYVVTGQTLALAWELPHKPISLEDLYTAPGQQQTDALPQQADNFTPSPPFRRQDSYYFGDGGVGGGWRWDSAQRKWMLSDDHMQEANKIDRYDSAANRWQPPYVVPSTTANPEAGRDIIINDNFPFIRKRPIISLPLGKRSLPQRMETAYERHHRDSRYDLYRLVELFLTANGHNGTACVLKTLCEVGQHYRDQNSSPEQSQQPGSFVAEIVRVIFKLPGTGHLDRSPAEKYHSAANHRVSCAAMFPHCSPSIWTAAFFAQ